MEYGMVSFVDQRAEVYVGLAGIPVTKLSLKAQTPFLDETNAFTKNMPEGLLSNIALSPHEDVILCPIS